MSNSDFAIYINSASSQIPSNEKSRVTIPFLSNIAKHDALKSAQLSLLSFRFVNSVYNIKEGYSKLKVLTKYAAGRGLPESEEFIELDVPYGNYDADKLATYFSTVSNLGFEVIQQLFQYEATATYPATNTNCDIYVGFGAYPLGEEDPEITPALSYDNTQTKLYFQSPDLKHMIQYKTDTFTPCFNTDPNDPNVDPTTVLAHSYIYDGIYLILDSETEGLMSLLGFETSSRFEIPIVSTMNGVFKRGYGITFKARNMYSNTEFTSAQIPPNYDINLARVEYGFSKNGSDVWPTTQNTINFQGFFVDTDVHLTVPTTTNDLPSASNPKGEIAYLPVAALIAGDNVTNGSPIVVSIIQTFFKAWVNSDGIEYWLQWDDNNPDIPENQGPFIGMALSNASPNGYNPQTQTWDATGPVNGLIGITCTGRSGTNGRKISLSVSNSAPFYYELDAEGLPTGNEIPYHISPDNQDAPYVWYGFYYTLSLEQPLDTNLTPMTASKGTLVNPAATLFPQNVTNLSGLDEIYLKCAQLHTLAFASTNKQPLAPSDTIAVIPVDVAYAEKQTYMPQFPISCSLNNTNITQLDFVLTNSKNETLDFNGVDWSAVMAVTMQDIPVMQDNGTINTPFQAQLNVLEGTSFAEARKKRQMIFHSQSNF